MGVLNSRIVTMEKELGTQLQNVGASGDLEGVFSCKENLNELYKHD